MLGDIGVGLDALERKPDFANRATSQRGSERPWYSYGAGWPLAAAILAPRHFVCLLAEIFPANPMFMRISEGRSRLNQLSAWFMQATRRS